MFARTQRDTGRHRGTQRDTEGHRGTQRDTEGHRQTHRDAQRDTEGHIGTQGLLAGWHPAAKCFYFESLRDLLSFDVSID